MKAVLVIKMPSKCFNCPLHQSLDAEEGEHEFMMFCNAEHWRESVTHTPVENLEERPSWCPLRPLPKELHNYTAILHPTDNNDWLNNMYSEYENGWNDCLEAITGEKE